MSESLHRSLRGGIVFPGKMKPIEQGHGCKVVMISNINRIEQDYYKTGVDSTRRTGNV